MWKTAKKRKYFGVVFRRFDVNFERADELVFGIADRFDVNSCYVAQ